MPEAHMSPPTDDETTNAPSRESTDAPSSETTQEPSRGSTEEPSSETTQEPSRRPGELEGTGEADEGPGGAERIEEFAGQPEEPQDRPRMTPRQARRVRIVVSGLVMLAVAVALALRVATAPSVLTVGFYGVALILSGSALVLSRRGRTRVATGVLVLGLAAIVAAEWLLG